MDFCNDFSHDLKFGKLGEGLIADIFSNKKLEVKRDNFICKTGNIAVEFESRGKPSGIATSQADYWVFILSGDLNDTIILIFEINKLKEIARDFYLKGKIKLMGDDNTSKAILIPFKNII